MKLIYAFILSLLATMAMPNMVRAFSVAPAMVELSGERGEVVETAFSLINTALEDQTYFLGAMKFVPGSNGESPEFIPSDIDSSGIVQWIQYPASSISVPANSVVNVPVSIAIPLDVASGGYYGAFIVSDAPYEIVETNGTSVNARTAILVFLTVEGETVEKGELLDFKTTVDGDVLSHLSGGWSYRIQNQGNVHVTPQAKITIADVFGRVVQRVDANDAGGRVLPGSTRTYEGAFGQEETTGFFSQAKKQATSFALGPMTAGLSVEIGDEVFNQQSHFWFFPIELILCLSALVVMVLVMIALGKRKK